MIGIAKDVQINHPKAARPRQLLVCVVPPYYIHNKQIKAMESVQNVGCIVIPYVDYSARWDLSKKWYRNDDARSRRSLVDEANSASLLGPLDFTPRLTQVLSGFEQRWISRSRIVCG